MNKPYYRKRGRTVSFWVTEEDAKLLNDLVDISGGTKQDYIINKLLNREVRVYGNSRLYKKLQVKLEEVLSELKRLGCGNDAPPELWTLIDQINKTLYGLKEGE